ncbi:MAG: type II toxin-antitoxin system RelE/ParE family toxin [Defluviitaleaceae bacterium]|nr:type II toxin-antitoxin system RelE/ParE family toxin [Defluviitaleaceae bacterium]
MYKMVYLQRALDDLEEIHFYVANVADIDQQDAQELTDGILHALSNLETFPFIGSSVADRLDIRGDYRVIITKPYLIFYRVITTQVTIYRVLHSKRYYSALLDL